MDDVVPPFLEFWNTDLPNISKGENVLKLIDPPEHDIFKSLNVTEYANQPCERKQNIDNISCELLDLGEPPLLSLNDINHIDMRDTHFDVLLEIVNGKLKKSESHEELHPSSTKDIYLDGIVPCDKSDHNQHYNMPLVHDSISDDVFRKDSGHNMMSSVKVEHDLCIKFKHIITWVQPFSSIAVFVVVILIEMGLAMDYSIISLIAYISLLYMLFRITNKMAVSLEFMDLSDKMNCTTSFTKEDVHYCVDCSIGVVNGILKQIKSVVYLESKEKNISLFALFWILTYVGQFFNLMSLIIIGTLLLFTMPVLYMRYRSDIDLVCDRFRSTIKIKSKSP